MNKNTKQLVPKLRFPEFQNEKAWQPIRLDKIANRVSLKNKDGKVIRVLTNSAADGIVDQRDYFEKDIAVQGNLEGYYVVESGDYIYNPRVSNLAPVGPISKNKLGTGVMSPLYSVFRFKNPDNNFYEQYFKTPNWHHYLRSISNSGARHDRMAITADDFMSMPLPEPTPREQQKIADCLSSIDDLISAQSQKVEALKTHKKGIMRQLFPREGETVPRLRFPEFRGAGEWEEKALVQVAKYENGKAHEQDIADSGKFVVVNSKFISTEGEVRKHTNSPFCVAEKNDILMVLSDVPNGRAIAKCFLVDTDNRYTVNQRICRLTPHKAVSLMLFYVLDRNPYFLAFDDGVKQTNLKKNDVLECPILLPKDINEQQKIADFLSNIDGFITTQTQKLESLKNHKKGLMQQLFPSMEAGGE